MPRTGARKEKKGGEKGEEDGKGGRGEMVKEEGEGEGEEELTKKY